MEVSALKPTKAAVNAEKAYKDIRIGIDKAKILIPVNDSTLLKTILKE